MRRALILLALLASACDRRQAADPPPTAGPEPTNSAATRPVARPAAAPAAVSVSETDDVLEFVYGWPAEAAAIPALDARFREEMATARAEARGSAEEGRRSAGELEMDYRRQSYERVWTKEGESDRLLSLESMTAWDSGGAHPNYGIDSRLWDKVANREIGVADLFDPPTRFAALVQQRWCAALDRERSARRDGALPGGDGFWECPSLSDLALVPSDEDKDGRFERIYFIASPYVAGPYSEGRYDIELRIDPAIIAAMKPEMRASFEPA